MGDNLNTNGAAPVAPYVFLSFMFEIMVEFMIYFVLIRRPQRPLQPLPHALHSVTLLKFGERTLATAGSHDFTDDEFFPDLGNLILDDMGDNVNAGGAAPAAPYVILSLLFEIVVEFMFLVCALDCDAPDLTVH